MTTLAFDKARVLIGKIDRIKNNNKGRSSVVDNQEIQKLEDLEKQLKIEVTKTRDPNDPKYNQSKKDRAVTRHIRYFGVANGACFYVM